MDIETTLSSKSCVYLNDGTWNNSRMYLNDGKYLNYLPYKYKFLSIVNE